MLCEGLNTIPEPSKGRDGRIHPSLQACALLHPAWCFLFSSSWSGLTQAKGHPHRQGHPCLGEGGQGKGANLLQDTVRALKAVPCPCSSGDSRGQRGSSWEGEWDALCCQGLHRCRGWPDPAPPLVPALPSSSHPCPPSPTPSLPSPPIADAPSSSHLGPGPTPATCLGERSNALSQLRFHLGQRLCLSHCLLQLLLRQLQQLLQVPGLLLALQDSRVGARPVPPPAPPSAPSSPWRGDTLGPVSVPGGAGTPCWPTRSPVCH